MKNVNVYVIKNTENSSVYVGATVSEISKRLAQHKKNSQLNKENKFYRAMNEIGVDKFYIELLETVPKEAAATAEDRWIDFFDSIYNGYNTLRSSYVPTQSHKTNKEKDVDPLRNKEKQITRDIVYSDMTNEEIMNKYNLKYYEFSAICRGKGRYVNSKFKYPLRGLTSKKKSLSKNEVNRICELLANTDNSMTNISEEFNVSLTAVSNINMGISHCSPEIEYPIRQPVGVRRFDYVPKDESLLIIDLLKKGCLYDDILSLVETDMTYKHLSRIDKGKSKRFDYSLYRGSFPIRKRKLKKNDSSDIISRYSLG